MSNRFYKTRKNRLVAGVVAGLAEMCLSAAARGGGRGGGFGGNFLCWCIGGKRV